MPGIGSITLEITIGFIALFTITKFIGKRQITPLTPFDFISAIVLGELLGNAIYDPETGVGYILYALSLWGLLMFLIHLLERKFIRIRKIIADSPAVIIRNGQIDYQELKNNKMTITQLRSLLREKDVFSLREVEYAILEPNGEITVLNKYEHGSPSRQDLDLPQQEVDIPITLITDGQVLWQNLKYHNLDRDWLEQKLLDHQIHKFEDVLYAEWSTIEGIHIQTFQ
ncbi:DUF421 domain-containing protein [Halanaerobaculum tunisiense]